jgi:hypothetical protein
MMKFKLVCYKHEVVSLLVTLSWSLKYKLTHDRWRTLIELAQKWQNERDYPFRDDLNNDLQKLAREKYGIRLPYMVDVTDRRIWLTLPYCKEGKMFGVQIAWSKSNSYTFFASVKEDDVWKYHYAKLLFKIAYDFKNLTRSVTINDRELKVGEWMAALLFELTGDHAGMLATLDEAEDRK